MRKSKHTPGPYKRQGWLVTTENGGTKICHYIPRSLCIGWSTTDTRQEDHDTINLLAAAPELLEALEFILSQFGKQDGHTDYSAIDKAESAIKKAKGE